jgi:hypothetical protein
MGSRGRRLDVGGTGGRPVGDVTILEILDDHRKREWRHQDEAGNEKR